MSVTTRIPETLISSGWGIPTVCRRHGEPAVKKLPTRFASTTPTWAYALVLLGFVPFIVAAVLLRKRVAAPAWPFCTRCGADHKKRLMIGFGLVGGGILIGVGSVTALTDDLQSLGLILALITIITGLGICSRADRAGIAGGVVVSGGAEVEFARAHEVFAQQVAQAQQHAAQQHTAQTEAPRYA